MREHVKTLKCVTLDGVSASLAFYFEAGRRRSVLVSTERGSRVDYRDFPDMVFGVGHLMEKVAWLSAWSCSAERQLMGMDLQKQCLGYAAAKRICSGRLDPIDAYWSTAFLGGVPYVSSRFAITMEEAARCVSWTHSCDLRLTY